jgi:hypothetical protein
MFPTTIYHPRNPNPLVLTAVLNDATRLTNALGPNTTPFKHFQVNCNYSADTYMCGAIHSIYNSPLVTAIKACLPQNVAALLAAGADPNGILLGDLDKYSVCFIHSRNPEYNTYSYIRCTPSQVKVMATVGDDIPQTALLTPNEITAH